LNMTERGVCWAFEEAQHGQAIDFKCNVPGQLKRKVYALLGRRRVVRKAKVRSVTN